MSAQKLFEQLKTELNFTEGNMEIVEWIKNNPQGSMWMRYLMTHGIDHPHDVRTSKELIDLIDRLLRNECESGWQTTLVDFVRQIHSDFLESVEQ